MKHTASFLTDVIEYTTPLLLKINDEQASIKPAPTKWSYKEIIGHLIDSAANNHQKFIRTAMEDDVHFPPYAQDDWVAIQQYNKANWESLLTIWQQYNKLIAHIIHHLPATASEHEIYIGNKGPFTLEFIVADYVPHLKHHLKEILPEASFLENDFKMIY